tara:strand:- start:118 stop:603 length:486 start_codon:yes stop_codon:yes gene_type:complete
MNEDQQHEQSQRQRGILGDVQSVKHNGVASLAELREFIGSLKGRKPQEVMGDVASNGLVQGILLSTVGFVVILLVFTVIPFFMADEEPVAQKENNSTVTSTSEETPEEQEATQETDPQAPTAEGETGDAVLDNLGIGETKEANPDENPLGDKFNDLLEGVK